MTISSPDIEVPSFVSSPDLGQPMVALLTGAGNHQLAVDTFGGADGSFTIEVVDMGEER